MVKLKHMKKQQKIILKLLVFLAIIAIGFSIVSLLRANKKEIQPRAPQEASWLVETIPIKLGVYAPYQQLYGKINTERLVKILASGGAEVKEVLVSSGELVEKEQTLVTLDTKDFSTNEDRNTAQVKQTELELKQANYDIANVSKLLELERQLLVLDKKKIKRNRALSKQQNISDVELEKSEEAYVNRQKSILSQEKNKQNTIIRKARLEARLESEKSQLKQASINLQRSTQKSPIDGLVTRVNVQTGSRVGQNSVMLEILPLHNLEMTATLLNDQLPTILQALQNEQPINASVNVFGLSLEATLVRLRGESNAGGAVGVFKFKNISLETLQHIRPNTFFSVLLQRPEVEDSILVPFSAIYGSDKIYVVREGRLHSIKVTLLGNAFSVDNKENWALIKSDELRSDDQISITHLPNATQNLRVNIKKTQGE